MRGADGARPHRLPGIHAGGFVANAKRRLLILVGIAISVLFLWLALKDTNFAEIGAALERSQLWLMAPLLLAYGAYYWLKAIRWRILLKPMAEVRTNEIVSPMMIGFMGNNILPAHLGEFIRMYLGAKQLGLRKTQVLATIVLERMFDVLSVVLFLGLVLIVGKNVPEKLVTVGYVTAAIGVAAMALVACYVKWTDRFLRELRRLLFFMPGKIREAILHQLEVGVEGLAAIKRPGLLFGIATTSLGQWACMGVSNYLAIRAIGIDTRMSAAFVVLAATTFAVTLPTAPGFLGTVQYAFTVALVPYGIAAGDAVAASAFFHVPTYLAVTIVGLWFLKRTGYRLSQLREDAEDEFEDAVDPPAA